MTDEELAAIRERLSAATPGPWVSYDGHEIDRVVNPDDAREDELIVGSLPYESGGVVREEDTDFIAHAPDDVRTLLAEVECLRARGEALAAIAQVVADAQVVATHPHFGETTYRVTDDGRLQERARTLLAKEPQP